MPYVENWHNITPETRAAIEKNLEEHGVGFVSEEIPSEIDPSLTAVRFTYAWRTEKEIQAIHRDAKID